MGLGRRESGADAQARGGSDNLRRVVDALLEGTPVAPEDQAALTDSERAEVASLVRTAHFTRVVLHQDQPNPAAEQAALDRAQTHLQTRLASGMAPVTGLPPFSADTVDRGDGSRLNRLREWMDRLLGRTGGDD